MQSTKFVDSKGFSLDLSSGLDMIGYKLINLGDASNPTDALNKKYVDTCK